MFVIAGQVDGATAWAGMAPRQFQDEAGDLLKNGVFDCVNVKDFFVCVFSEGV